MITMDFDIFLQAIGHMAVCLFFTGLIIGWVIFTERMIKNRLTSLFVAFLPIITVLTILKYHMIASS